MGELIRFPQNRMSKVKSSTRIFANSKDITFISPYTELTSKLFTAFIRQNRAEVNFIFNEYPLEVINKIYNNNNFKELINAFLNKNVLSKGFNENFSLFCDWFKERLKSENLKAKG